MATTGFVLAGTGASVDRASATAWTTPGNITADDASTASAAVPTDYLVCSNFAFSSIPDGSTINGVIVRVQSHETGTGSSDYVVQLQSGTTPTLIGSSKASGTVSGTTPTNRDAGTTSDVWGATLTTAIVKNSGFGVSLWSTDTTNTLLVDVVWIEITYTLALTQTSTFTNSNTLTYEATASHVLPQASTFTNSNTLTYAHTLTPGEVALTQSSTYTNPNSLAYQHDVAPSGGSQSLTQDSTYTNTNSLAYAHQVGLVLTQGTTYENPNSLAYAHQINLSLTQSSTFTNSNALTYAHQIDLTLTQATTYTNPNSLAYTHQADLTLIQASSYTNPNTLTYAHTLTPGTVALTQDSTYSNQNSLAYQHQVDLGLTQSVTFSNSNSLAYGHALALYLTPDLFTNGNSLAFQHAVDQGQNLSQSARFDNSNSLSYGHQLDLVLLQGARFDNAQAYYVHLLAPDLALTPDLFVNSGSLAFQHSVQQDQALSQASRYDGVQTHYQHQLDLVLLQASRFDSAGSMAYEHAVGLGLTQSARFDTVGSLAYQHQVGTNLSQGARFDNSQGFYAAVLSFDQVLTPALFQNSGSLSYAHTVAVVVSQFFDEFGSYATGSLTSVAAGVWSVPQAAGWTSTVTAEGGATGGKTLVFSNATSGHNVTRYLPPGTTTGDIEVVSRFKMASDSGATFPFSIGPHIAHPTTHYGYSLMSWGTDFAICRTQFGQNSGTLTAWTEMFDIVQNNIYYWVRLGRSGTTIRAKVWRDSEAEPGAWSLTVTNETYYSELGPQLQWYLNWGQPYTVDLLGVGINGYAAPKVGPNRYLLPAVKTLTTAALVTSTKLSKAASATLGLAAAVTSYQAERTINRRANATTVAVTASPQAAAVERVLRVAAGVTGLSVSGHAAVINDYLFRNVQASSATLAIIADPALVNRELQLDPAVVPELATVTHAAAVYWGHHVGAAVAQLSLDPSAALVITDRGVGASTVPLVVAVEASGVAFHRTVSGAVVGTSTTAPACSVQRLTRVSAQVAALETTSYRIAMGAALVVPASVLALALSTGGAVFVTTLPRWADEVPDEDRDEDAGLSDRDDLLPDWVTDAIVNSEIRLEAVNSETRTITIGPDSNSVAVEDY